MSTPTLAVVARSQVNCGDIGVGTERNSVRRPSIIYVVLPRLSSGMYPYTEASCAFPSEPYEPRIFSSLITDFTGLKKASSLIRHPADTEGNVPKRCRSGNLDVPS